MTDDRSFERAARSWLEVGPTRAPDRTLEAAFLEIQTTPQERDWHVPWRLPKMTTPARVAAAVVVGVLVVGVSLYVFKPGSSPGVGGPGASPSPIASPAPSAPSAGVGCEDDLPGCAGPLQAGTQSSSQFGPKLRYSVPSGWTNSIDTASIFKLDRTDGTDPYILIWTDVDMAEQTPTCSATAKTTGRASVDTWVDYLTSHPGLDTDGPTPVAVGGAQATNAVAIDVRVAPDWTQVCPGSDVPEVILLAHRGAPEAAYGVDADHWLHLVLVEVGDATVVIEVYGSPRADALAAAVADVQPIIDSFKFGCGPSVPRPCGE